MKVYETYIFDLDGTITDSMSAWIEILRDTLLNFGMVPPDDKTILDKSHDWTVMLKENGVHDEKIQEFVVHVHKLANERLHKAPFHSGAYETLEKLKNQNKQIGIFSSMDRPLFHPAMERGNLYSITDIAVAGTDVPHRKPHPAGIQKVLDHFKIPKSKYETVVYMGDKDTDIQAGHNAGIDSILYYPISHQLMYDLESLKTHKPEHIITDWLDLLT